jgi:hypothetical protein
MKEHYTNKNAENSNLSNHLILQFWVFVNRDSDSVQRVFPRCFFFRYISTTVAVDTSAETEDLW